MAQQTTPAAAMGEFQSRGDDFLHLKNSQGTVVGGIDNTGTGFGTLQGGFIPPATKALYVDGNRTDSYTADGSLLKPFKTIMAAVNQVIANGDNSLSVPYLIDVAPGMYPELIILENAALVYLIFEGHGSAAITSASAAAGIRSTANNSNLVGVDIRRLNIGGGGAIAGGGTSNLSETVSLSGSGNFLSDGLNFYDLYINCSGAWTQTGGNSQFFDTSYTMGGGSTITSVGVFSFFGNRGPTSGNFLFPIALVSSTMTLQRGCRCGNAVTIDAASSFTLSGGARQDNRVTVNGAFSNRFSYVTGAITVNNGGTYSERGGYHDGTLTINSGGTYSQLGVSGVGGVVLGAAAPTVPSGEIGLGNGTAATATAGSGSLPAAPAGFLIINVGGTVQKIPYYNT